MLILVTSGFIITSTGVTGLYIGKIFEQVKGRPLYVVDQAVGVDVVPARTSPSTTGRRSPADVAKSIAVVQSSYIPWKGYFDLINRVDEFVLSTTLQYTRRDWRNRKRIKTRAGTQWLTIPVERQGPLPRSESTRRW